MVGITSYGAYVPRLRLDRKSVVAANAWSNAALKAHGRGERAMCNWDEDSLTMAVAAARDCLGETGRDGLGGAYLASTTLPFADRQNAAIMATALNLEPGLSTMDVTSSQRAGTTALMTGLDAVRGTGDTRMVVAAEKRRTKAASPQELIVGDAAAALTIGTDGVIAEHLASYSLADDFIDHYRGDGFAFDYTWEERWIRDEGYMKILPKVIDGLLARAGIGADAIDHVIVPAIMPAVFKGLGKHYGFAEGALRDNLQAVLGQSGVAHPLVMLVAALEEAKPGETILVIGFGQGGDALLFRATEAIAGHSAGNGVKGSLAAGKTETNYQKFLAFNGLINRELGFRAEGDRQTALTALYRKKEMILGLVGGKCRTCGTLQFPKTGICVNPNCGDMDSQDSHPFADMAASVASWSADHLAFSMDPPGHYGMVQFAEGGRFFADFTDLDEGEVEVGMPMKMVFRIKEFDDQRGFRKYFWKAAPAPR